MAKYRNSKVKILGITFDSKLEADHYLELCTKAKAGKIKDLSRQVKIELTSNAEKHKDKVHYIADFVFFDLSLNSWVVWDSKGMPTDAYKIKRKWLLDMLGGFVFIEASRNSRTTFEARGKISLF